MPIWPDILLHALIMHFGMLIFFCRKALAAKVHSSEGEPRISDYWRKHPTTTLMAVVGSYAGFLIALQFEQLNYFSALGIGFMADSVADAAARSHQTKLEVDRPPQTPTEDRNNEHI